MADEKKDKEQNPHKPIDPGKPDSPQPLDDGTAPGETPGPPIPVPPPPPENP